MPRIERVKPATLPVVVLCSKCGARMVIAGSEKTDQWQPGEYVGAVWADLDAPPWTYYCDKCKRGVVGSNS